MGWSKRNFRQTVCQFRRDYITEYSLEYVYGFRWLTHVQEPLMLNESEQSPDISWSAFNAFVVEKQTGMEDVSTLLPLFQESSSPLRW